MRIGVGACAPGTAQGGQAAGGLCRVCEVRLADHPGGYLCVACRAAAEERERQRVRQLRRQA